jgi:hypothetical protein
MTTKLLIALLVVALFALALGGWAVDGGRKLLSPMAAFRPA